MRIISSSAEKESDRVVSAQIMSSLSSTPSPVPARMPVFFCITASLIARRATLIILYAEDAFGPVVAVWLEASGHPNSQDEMNGRDNSVASPRIILSRWPVIIYGHSGGPHVWPSIPILSSTLVDNPGRTRRRNRQSMHAILGQGGDVTETVH